MNLDTLPRDLADLCTGFAFDATMLQTKRSVMFILEIKRQRLHPFIRANLVRDYTGIKESWHYDREHMQPGILAPFIRDIPTRPSPLYHFFVWFSFSELWDVRQLSLILHDLDWRKVAFVRSETGVPDRHALMLWACSSLEGIDYCSHLFDRVEHRMLKKYPSNLGRVLATSNYEMNNLLAN